MVLRFAWLFAALLLVATGASAATEAEVRRCIDQSASAFGISPVPIRVLREVEGGAVGKVSRANKNGTYDIGPMQVNSLWLPALAELGISERDLRDNACINVYVGTWIYYNQYLKSRDVVLAMARYHSPGARHHQARYLGLVQRVLERHIARAQRELAGPLTQLASTKEPGSP
jgi:soluble lytic murein transglycosylase-like protein